jgi:hypothetical protein
MEDGSISSHGRAPRSGWRPGPRLERLRGSHSYAYVLVVIGVTFVFLFAAPAENSVQGVLVLIEAAMLAVALWTSGIMQDYRPALLLLVIGLIAALAQVTSDTHEMRGTVALLDVALVLATVVVIALGVVDQREINRQSISGAVCVYLLLGTLFTFVFGAAAELGSGAFFAQGSDGTPAIRVYFSYVTLATLGYGDYTAAGALGRCLAVVEALLGQLYLVTVVALLVGRFGQRRGSA